MSDNVLTSEPQTTAPATPETVAANEAAPHDVAPPEPADHSEAPAPEEARPPANKVCVAEEPEPEAIAAEEEEEEAEPEAASESVAAEEPSNKHWYVVKVQSGREETIKEAIERRVKIERLEEYFGEIKIPVERVTEMRNSKRVVKERKLYPGYIMANVELADPDGHVNDKVLYLFRETSGVGDFVGMTMTKGKEAPLRAPPPMSQREVDRMLGPKGGAADKEKALPEKPPVDKGDRVRVRDGTFAGMEGEVKELLEAKGSVSVELTIFGRPVKVEFEYWQVEQA
jgi:transcription termination/antitermination protein NusG